VSYVKTEAWIHFLFSLHLDTSVSEVKTGKSCCCHDMLFRARDSFIFLLYCLWLISCREKSQLYLLSVLWSWTVVLCHATICLEQVISCYGTQKVLSRFGPVRTFVANVCFSTKLPTYTSKTVCSVRFCIHLFQSHLLIVLCSSWWWWWYRVKCSHCSHIC
jgi:hypothetical protein